MAELGLPDLSLNSTNPILFCQLLSTFIDLMFTFAEVFCKEILQFRFYA
ncbi:hypothetical protein MiYa_04487 [Microcystis aeruginosa NIES-2519]|uniref:Uncharacterized protein n=2 Tax=Microcystis aeruginosa TaxID=1126 RepID=I4IU27_MICAE|nr:hypothetical protein MiYa_04487 [Microcystis aeruginosa NIES-2519]GCA86410.1 hypothetical protein MiHa_04401 [Microcystis aeruginosa NIES-2522]CCI37801.1 hypothetical protein MICAK_3500003 [Microcystis aeruginosa PCC 9701]